MKLCVTMQKDREYNVYTFKGPNDSRFYPLLKILSKDFQPYQLVDWLGDEKQMAESSEWVYIRKERGIIALYDVSDSMDETYTGEYLVPEKRFEVSIKNFAEILYQWEELRVSRPETILIVIHEDNHVSLETNPIIIKEYQDAGYVFNINKK